MRTALAVALLLLSGRAAVGAVSDEDLWRADWTLSDQELFEVVAAETSKSTVGRERSIQSGPAEPSDADDPGPESSPSPGRNEGGPAAAPAHGRVGLRASVQSAALRLAAPLPLRL
jgi:hypothetical protein